MGAEEPQQRSALADVIHMGRWPLCLCNGFITFSSIVHFFLLDIQVSLEVSEDFDISLVRHILHTGERYRTAPPSPPHLNSP
jgi:hypothetical protein